MSERKVVLLQDFAPAMGNDLKSMPADDLKMLIEYFRTYRKKACC